MKTKVLTASLSLVAVVLSFVLGQCSGENGETPNVPESAVIVREVDTVVRVIDRPPIRVVFHEATATDAGTRVRVDTIREADTIRLDTLEVEQRFAAVSDTVLNGDTVRVFDSVVVRAPRGPVTLVSLRTRLEMIPLPDTLHALNERVIVTVREGPRWYRDAAVILATAAATYVVVKLSEGKDITN